LRKREVTKKICANEWGRGWKWKRTKVQKETEEDKKKNKRILEIWTEAEGRNNALGEQNKT
jgi:hypothetical protein